MLLHFFNIFQIYDWIPEYYTKPLSNMPAELAAHINNVCTSINFSAARINFCVLFLQSPPDERKQVWISCNGVDDFDKENIKGFRYSPHGFPAYYYPYKNTPRYLSPLVAVEVLDITREL